VIKSEEAFLVRADLIDVDMIVSGFGKRLDLLDMLGRSRPTHDYIGDLVFPVLIASPGQNTLVWVTLGRVHL